MSSNPIVVGCFGKPFGIKGWIKVNSFTTPPQNILTFEPWLIQKKDAWEEINFEDSRQHHKNVAVKLPGCNSPEEARNFTNIKIAVLHKQLPELKPNEYYWEDLIGLKVTNLDGIELGIVKELFATGSNDVLIIIGDRKRLVPYTSDVIHDIDLKEKTIKVDWDKDF